MTNKYEEKIKGPTIGEAFAAVGGWMAGGELGYPSFGSMEALAIYTQKMIRAALASKAHEPAPSAWLPIESAPRDGTLILLGRAEEEWECPALVLLGRWHEASCDAPDDMGHDAGFIDDGFFGNFRCGRSFGNPDYQGPGYQPTHWQKLPDAPAKESGNV